MDADQGAARPLPIPPLMPEPPQIDRAPERPDRAGASATPARRVLVLEADPTLRAAVLDGLERAGRGGDGVDTLRAAVASFRARRHPAAVLGSPADVDSAQAARTLRALAGPGGLRIVGLVADAAAAGRLRRAVAVDGCVEIPPTPEGLAAALPPAVPVGGATGWDGLDAEVIARLRGDLAGVPGALASVIEAYLGELPARRQAIVAAARDRDAERLRFAAHSLKSSSALVGASAVAGLCLRLEALAREAGDAGTVDAAVLEFEDACAVAAGSLGRLLGEARADQPSPMR